MTAIIAKASATIRAVLLLGGIVTLSGISVNCISQRHQDQGDCHCGAASLSLIQRNITKSHSLALPKLYSKEQYSLLQQNQILSKTEVVWDENGDDEPTSSYVDFAVPNVVNPIEMALETLDVPVNANAAPWPPVLGPTALLLQSSQVESTAAPANQATSNASRKSDHSASPATFESPPLRLKKEIAVPLSQRQRVAALTEIAEAKWQLPDASKPVDPPQSLSHDLPLERLDRMTLSGSQKALASPLRGYGHYGIFYVVGLVVVMLFVACPTLSADISEELRKDKFKLVYDDRTDQWIESEVVGELKDQRLMLRRQNDGKLFSLDARTDTLRSMDLTVNDLGPAVEFPPYRPYRPKQFALSTVVDGIHWRIKEVHERIVTTNNRAVQRHERRFKADDDEDDDELSVENKVREAIDSHLKFAVEGQDGMVELEEKMAMGYVAFEEAAGHAIQEMEVLEKRGVALTQSFRHGMQHEVQEVESKAAGMESKAAGVMNRIKSRFRLALGRR